MKSQTSIFPTNGNTRAKQTAHYPGVHISTIWRYAKHPNLSKSHQLADGMTVFNAAAAHQWNKQKTGGENA